MHAQLEEFKMIVMTRFYIPRLDHEIIALDFGQKGSQNQQQKIQNDFAVDLKNYDILVAKEMNQRDSNGFQAIYNLKIIPCRFEYENKKKVEAH